MPLQLPSGWRSHKLRPIQFQHVNPFVARRAQTIVRKEPLWYAEFTSTNLSEQRLGEIQGFFDQLDGAVNSFLVYDPRKVRPRTFAASLAGSLTVTAVNYELSIVAVSGTPISGLTLQPGDMISWLDGDRYCLHRVTKVSPLYTGGANVHVYPRPLSLLTSNPAVSLAKASCEMIVTESDDTDDLETGGTFKFKAMQIKR